MPELPDIELYLHALRQHVLGQPLTEISIRSPFLLRTCQIEPGEMAGRTLTGVTRMGKRIVWQLEGGFYLVFHLMIAGRFHRRPTGYQPRGKHDLAAFGFTSCCLILTEHSTRKRAALHLLPGASQLESMRRRGIDVTACNEPQFAERLQQKNRTVKLALIDPDTFDGIGNAYSDEILHRAALSPYARTQQISGPTVSRLFHAARATLNEWRIRLIEQCGDRFPERVTAFRPEMAVHGRFGKPCPRCQATVQRISFGEKEWNYCPGCQTGGRRLADRRLSRLLKDDWPDELE